MGVIRWDFGWPHHHPGHESLTCGVLAQHWLSAPEYPNAFLCRHDLVFFFAFLCDVLCWTTNVMWKFFKTCFCSHFFTLSDATPDKLIKASIETRSVNKGCVFYIHSASKVCNLCLSCYCFIMILHMRTPHPAYIVYPPKMHTCTQTCTHARTHAHTYTHTTCTHVHARTHNSNTYAHTHTTATHMHAREHPQHTHPYPWIMKTVSPNVILSLNPCYLSH